MKRVLVAWVVVMVVLAYLRDPVWLAGLSSGIGPWEHDEEGHAFRWTSGHASFFVPADARLVRLPMSAGVKDAGRHPVFVRVTVNDREADLVRLDSDRWVTTDIVVAGLATGHRRQVRIDLFVDRVAGDGDHGVRLRGAGTVK